MTRPLTGRTYWLIGASEGLGRALARALDGHGARLVLSARSQMRLETLAQSLKQTPAILLMDVTDPANVSAAARQTGPLDGIIYMAGTYEPMTAQQWDARKVTRMCEVNFTGATRVLGEVLPGFIARNEGEIILIGSLAGYRGLPGAIGYGASKAALMHLAETLQADLWHTGVKIRLINPGFVRTRLTGKNTFRMPFLMEPGAAADRVIRAMQGRTFTRDFPWGFSLVFRAGRLLPQWLYQRLFAPRPN